MMKFSLRSLAKAALGCCLAAHALAVLAWPDRPIRLVVPAPAGGSFDTIARFYADSLSKDINKPVIVDNRPGAGGAIAAQAMLNAPADGHTLFITGSNIITEIPHMVPPPYDPLRDIKPVAALSRFRYVLVTAPDFPAQDMSGLERVLKENPKSGAFASGSAGTVSHFFGEILNQRYHVDLQHIPFPGAPPALVAVMGKQVSYFLDSFPTSRPLLQSGKLKALGITGSSRFSQAPDVPTFDEQGYPEFKGFFCSMIVMASPKVPAQVVEQIRVASEKVKLDPAFQKRTAEAGFESIDSMSSEQLTSMLTAEYEWAGNFGKKLGLKQ